MAGLETRALTGVTMHLSVRNLSKRYGHVQALDDFSVELENGLYGLLGVNGAGKTTFLRILVGLLGRDEGEIWVDGARLDRQHRSFLQNLGYLPQAPLFYRDFTVLEFLGYMAALKELPSKLAQRRISELIETVNLSDAVEKKVGALSGGMRQRLGIAQAMLNDPQILVLDEPTAGLDPQERIRFRNLISQFGGERLILLATHIVPDVEAIANRVIVMEQGKLLLNDAPEVLAATLEGKVWLVDEALDCDLSAYTTQKIANMVKHSTHLTLRLVQDEPPSPAARPAPPTLEDVFLYHCGQ